MVVVVEGKDWKKIEAAIDDVCISVQQLETMGLNVLEGDTVRQVEETLKANVKQAIRKELGIE